MRYVVVIPARLLSSRLPRKPLVEIKGKSLIQRTYEQCLLAVEKEKIYVATDSEEIKEHCEFLGINVVMTSEDCLTGTDRIAEFSTKVDADYYINVQGDEPLMNPDDIHKVIEACENNPGEIINGYAAIHNSDDYVSRSVPKVVFSEGGNLLYMSRSPIPGGKTDKFMGAFRQICVYGFPKDSLTAFASRRRKTRFESIEDIEILRFIEMDFSVKMIELSDDSIAVDHPEDIEKVLERLNEEH